MVNEHTRLLFIENVGNLICPAAFELGEDFKIVLLSSTEGEDKPVKYPVIFSDASVAVITKTDLIPHLDWDIKKCRQYIRQINPGVFIFEVSAKTGEGMSNWIEYLKSCALSLGRIVLLMFWVLSICIHGQKNRSRHTPWCIQITAFERNYALL